MNCDLQKQDDKLACSRCGFSMKYREGNILRNCDAGPKPELPPLTEQFTHLVKDLTQWGASGFQIPPKTERDRRVEICRACDLFVDGRCRECGCACAWGAWLDTKTCPHPTEGDKWAVSKSISRDARSQSVNIETHRCRQSGSGSMGIGEPF